MSIIRVLALSTASIAMSAQSLSAGAELSTYRGFQFGMTIAAVARHCGISPEPRIVDQRPELIQELMWLPPRVGDMAGDSAQKILFTFYNDQLSRIVVSYDRSRTEGLTAEDLVEAISTTYGMAALPAVGIAPMIAGRTPDDKILARWEDPQSSITLFRSKYLSTFGLVLLSKRLDGLTTVAHAEAILLDEREAPSREAARQQRRSDADRLKDETVRRVNKAAFKP
jgi:hypothetical protein